ncbi:hypothetical protein OE88DRAFT_1653277 [Heliocybe sulcata]|uniref:Actin cytoskeleton organization protein n=1 Tax=Heliocybe sulcata TaxID=5364 RepID=A0A5C3ND29_9AGAM|nr:hypothetical protein OE88DRAFT_1653277 [Heliocybe sulcata]
MDVAAWERQIRPIYDALDTGSNKSAILSCNKLLKKYPNNDLAKALKALAMVRSQKVEESLILCDEVLARKPTDDATLSAMSHVLRGLGRHTDVVKMFEDAFKAQPGNEEYAAQTFFANARIGNWRAAQQIATKMHKTFSEDRYVHWYVMAVLLQAKDPATPEKMRDLLHGLAHRQLLASPSPSYVLADRLYQHLTVLRELKLYDDAQKLLEHDTGKVMYNNSLVVDELRRELWQSSGRWTQERELAVQRITEKKDRNWLEFLSVLDGTFAGVASSAETSEEARADCKEQIYKTSELFTRVSEEDGLKDRSGLLGLLELAKRSKQYGFSPDFTELVLLLQKYWHKFGDKACFYEDVKPYLDLDADDLSRWVSFLDSQQPSYDTEAHLRRAINWHKTRRFTIPETEITPELESARASQYIKAYIAGLPLGNKLPETELQPADDLAILAAHAFISSWSVGGSEKQLYNASVILEYGLTKSRHSYHMRLLLIQIYRLLGASSLALEHYRDLNVKQVQNDTLSHLILARVSTFSLAGSGDITYSNECLESSHIYMNNSQETSDWIVRAFTQEKYSQIPDLIALEERLDNSLQRDLVKLEHVRMRFTHEPINSELIDMELIELKFNFDRFHHDNRDLDIISNYQPRCSKSTFEQSLLFKKLPGSGWLFAFLKIYIRALQHASDVDDTVEAKLLIGDRPKQSHEPEMQRPLKERLATRKQAELDELTPSELAVYDFATALGDWLEPHHDYIRPPPSKVLADASKQAEAKTGRPLQGIDATDSATNGQSKKDEEAPQVREVPVSIAGFFDDMLASFKKLVEEGALPPELLHVATLTQEALLLFSIETMRFKPASIVKMHKLGALVADCKTIRAKAVATLKEMTTELTKISEKEGSSERRKAFVQECRVAQEDGQIDHDFVLNIAKRVTDSRKKVQEGMAKSIVKICSKDA